MARRFGGECHLMASTDLTAPKFDFRSSPERWGNRPAQLVDS
jgi:hypothetical protein